MIARAALALAVLCCSVACADDALREVRYCTTTPARDADGTIHRRGDVLDAFRRLYPCPATGRTSGACPGWNIDHTIPLVCGGCDAVYNLSWMPVEIKRCGQPYCKDRWEQRVYCRGAATRR